MHGGLGGAQREGWCGEQDGNATVMLLGGFAKDWKECTEKRRGRDQVWRGGGDDEWMADKRVKVAAEAAKPNVSTK